MRFSLTMLVALGLISFWALLAFERTLRNQLETALEGAVAWNRSLLASGGKLVTLAEHDDYHEFTERLNRFIVLRDSRGAIVGTNTPLAADLPLDRMSFAQARHGGTAKATGRWRDDWIRSMYVAAPLADSSGTLVLHVAMSLRPIAEANRQLLFVMFGTVLLGTMATAFGAFWLARSAVSPVIAVAQQAAAIAPDTQGKRITVHADVAEYESLITVLNSLLERCERAFSTQRRFIGDVGHELRTPLAALQGSLEVALRNERTPRDYQLVLRDALEEVEHLGRMSESLLLITRAEGGAIELHRAGTDLNRISRDVVDRMRRRIEEKGLALTLALDYEGERPLLDERLVARSFQGLVDNAVRLTPVGGRLALGTRSSAGGVKWWIEDSGPGIPAEDLPRLFEPFYRVDPARTRDGGSGLGLTLTASIVRVHGGTIRAANLPSGGARFEVEFPVPKA